MFIIIVFIYEETKNVWKSVVEKYFIFFVVQCANLKKKMKTAELVYKKVKIDIKTKEIVS